MRILLALALSVVWCLPLRVEASPPKKSKPAKQVNVKITYLHSTVTPETDDEEATGTGQLTTSWYTPAGKRSEMGNGEVAIVLTKGPVFCFINPEEKTGRRLDMNRLNTPISPALRKQIEASFIGKMGSQALQSARKEMFLGRDCQVHQVAWPTSEGRTQMTTWSAQVGGHDVVLRTLSKTFKNRNLVRVWLTEAVQIQVVSKPPVDLLQIPADYTISEGDPNLLVKMLPEMEKLFRAQGEQK